MSRARTIAIALALVVSAGCLRRSVRDERLYELGPPLTKLTAVVDAAVRDEGAPENLSEEELLGRATAHDRTLLDPFKGYRLRVARDGLDSAVLVCTSDGRVALLEDAGCTNPLDSELWTRPKPVPCEFTLPLRELCRDAE